ncbi:uncharacterized protein LOC113211117 [Frankliniella occidentalis]|uniref:Uncharacterized protein LOC113211117 n=1 Tax=Frankliniella occidentalis TaxID=133901 RepID=A0A9C6U532_FRAOC|nr:uncharacterized protein LOC113211117 [Frankliniella occidentalis]
MGQLLGCVTRETSNEILGRANKMSQPSTTSEAANATDRHEEALLLPDLPYLPLLRVLSFLPSSDLMAVGRTCLRLAALTRAHPWLWRHFNYVSLKSNEEVWELLRVAPPVEWLELLWDTICFDPPSYVVQPSVLVGNTYAPCRSLCISMWMGNFIDTSALRVMAPMVRRLDFRGVVPLDLILNALRAVFWSALEHLELRPLSGPQLGPWMQEVLLPRMHTVTFEATVECLEVFGSLLRAHRGQLRCVRIFRGELLPLVNDCPSDLNRLEVALQGGEDTAGLRGMHGLKELSITCEHEDISRTTLMKNSDGRMPHHGERVKSGSAHCSLRYIKLKIQSTESQSESDVHKSQKNSMLTLKAQMDAIYVMTQIVQEKKGLDQIITKTEEITEPQI